MELDRRQTLRAGGLVAGAVLAGCLDVMEVLDEEAEEDDEREARRPVDELTIGNLRLLSEAPAAYGEYDAVEDRQYPADAVVWFYVEPVGVATEDTGDGEERIELTSELTVTYRDETVATIEERFDRTVAEGETDELYLYFHFRPSITPARTGRYGATLTLTDELAGESVTEEVSFTIEEDERHEHSIEHVRFVTAQPTGYREYTTVDEPVYRRAEAIWVYFEPAGIGIEEREDERVASFDATATVTGPDGDDVGRVSDEVTISVPDSEGTDELFVYFELDLRRPQQGEHTVELAVRDHVRGGGASETVSFRIDDPELEAIEIFRDVLDDETDIDIERLTLVGEGTVVRLSYQSAHAHEEDPEAFGGEVGYIAGAYAGLLDETFSPERLLAGGDDQDGVEFSYVVDSDIARQYRDGELSSEEFVDYVFERLDI